MIQLPSIAPVPELGQASLAVALVGSTIASRFASQAPAFDAGVLDIVYVFMVFEKPDSYAKTKRMCLDLRSSNLPANHFQYQQWLVRPGASLDYQ